MLRRENALLLVLALGSGCRATLARPVIMMEPAVPFSVVPEQPPPALVEEVPPAPAASAVWVDGSWSWVRRRWLWNRGRWVVPPSGATYSPWAMAQGPDGTVYFAAAGWRDAHGLPMPEPTALAAAVVGPVVLVTRADGQTARITVTTPK